MKPSSWSVHTRHHPLSAASSPQCNAVGYSLIKMDKTFAVSSNMNDDSVNLVRGNGTVYACSQFLNVDCLLASRLQRKDILQLKDTFGITIDEAENVLKFYHGNMEDAVQFLTNQLKPFSADSYSAVTYGPENRKGTCYPS